MKRRCLGAERLKFLAVRTEQLRDGRRHLIGGRGQYFCVVGIAAAAVASLSAAPRLAKSEAVAATISGTAKTNDIPTFRPTPWQRMIAPN